VGNHPDLLEETRHAVSSRTLSAAALLSTLCLAPAAFAGTQDFTLVNPSGTDVYSLYISETKNDDWEEDVLGAGNWVKISFGGEAACRWDMMVTEADDKQLTFQGIKLCKASVVTLHCNDKECWADAEQGEGEAGEPPRGRPRRGRSPQRIVHAEKEVWP